MDLSAVAAMALLALPTAWLLSRDEKGYGPWFLALLWMALAGWSLALGMLSMPVGMVIWLLSRRRRQRRAFVQFVNLQGWAAIDPPTGFYRAFRAEVDGREVRVALGWGLIPGRRYIQPTLGFELVGGSWPDGWQAASRRRGGWFPSDALPTRAEPNWLEFNGVPRVEVLEARLADLRDSFSPGFDWGRLGRGRPIHPVWLVLTGAVLVLVGASQWIAWQKLRVFPAEPSLLLRSLSSLPRLIGVLRASEKPMVAVDGERLAVASDYGSIELYGLDGQARGAVPDSDGWTPVAFTGADLVACNQEGVVKLFPSTELGVQAGPTALATDGELVACGGKAAEVVIYSRQGGVVARMTRPLAPVSALACFEGRGLCGTEDGSLYYFELATGRLLAEREEKGAPVRAVAFSQGGMVSMGEKGCLGWTNQLERRAVYTGESAVAGAAQGSLVCVGFPDGSIEVYRQGAPLRLLGHQAPVTSLALAGNRLYSGANDGTVKIWKLD